MDALLDLYERGEVRPRAAVVAARAGVSERSVFRHFDDMEALAAAAIERHWARVEPWFAAPDRSGDLHERIAALVAQRVALHERVMFVARAGAIIAASSPTVTAGLAERRTLLGRQVTHHFANELAPLDRATRIEVARCLDAGLSLEAVEFLRGASGLSRTATVAALTRTATALLVSAPTLPEMP